MGQAGGSGLLLSWLSTTARIWEERPSSALHKGSLQQHSTPTVRKLGLKRCKLLKDKIQSQEGRKKSLWCSQKLWRAQEALRNVEDEE